MKGPDPEMLNKKMASIFLGGDPSLAYDLWIGFWYGSGRSFVKASECSGIKQKNSKHLQIEKS